MKKVRNALIVLMMSVFALGIVGGCSSKPADTDTEPATTFTVTYSSEDTNKGTATAKLADGTQVVSGSAVNSGLEVKFIATEKDGYLFNGWFEGETQKSTDKEYALTISADVNLVAKFGLNSYALTYSSEDESKGTVTCSDNITSGASVQFKKEVTLTATEKVGYSFLGWFEGETQKSTDKEYTFSMPSNALTLVAKFSANAFTFEYRSENELGGTVTCSNGIASGSSVRYGTSLTLTANVNYGYTFAGWFEGTTQKGSELTYNISMPNADLSIVAKFTIISSPLTYRTENQAHGNVNRANSSSGDSVEYNTLVTLTATANAGYEFVGWFAQGNDDTPVSTDAIYVFYMGAEATDLTAKFKLQTMKVTFYDGTDAIGEPIFVEYGTLISDSAKYQTVQNYVKPNHTFQYWKRQNGTQFVLSTPITENLNLYGYWEQNVTKYTVKFVDKDGRLIGEAQELEENTVIRQTQPAPNNLEGYDFDKWMCYVGSSVSGTGTELVLNSTTVTSDLTIQATYTLKKLVVSFFLDTEDMDDESAVADFTDEVFYNTTVDMPTNPADKEIEEQTYMFDKWVDASGTQFNFNGGITEKLSLYATWKLKPAETVTVEFYTDTAANGGTLIYSQVIEKNKDAVAPANPSKEGYDFTGWDASFTNVTQSIRVNATYLIKTYKVVFKDYDGSILKAEQTVNHGSTAIAPTDPERKGYSFKAWDKAYNEVKEDLTITATYNVNTFTIYFRTDDLSTPIYTYENVEYGSTISVPATPKKDGYSFGGWYVEESYTTKFDFTKPLEVLTQLTIYAKFDQIILETFDVVFMDGLTTISTQEITEGLSAIAPAAPVKTGYVFKEWDKAFDNVTADLIINAIYEKNKYEVKFFDLEGNQIGETILVEYEGYATAPASALIPSVPNKNFAGWDKNLETYKITENTSFFARYTTISKTVSFYKEIGVLYIQPVTVEQGSTVDMPTTPNKAGYVFRYWATEPVANKTDIENSYALYDFSTAVVNDIQLFAVYEKLADIFVVTFYDNEGNVYGAQQEVAKNEYAMQPAPFTDGTNDVYVWCVKNGEDYAIFDFDNTQITADLNLYAVLSSELN